MLPNSSHPENTKKHCTDGRGLLWVSLIHLNVPSNIPRLESSLYTCGSMDSLLHLYCGKADIIGVQGEEETCK